jgi:hypothetical protein
MSEDIFTALWSWIKSFTESTLFSDLRLTHVMILIGVCVLLHLIICIIESHAEDKLDDEYFDETDTDESWVIRKIPFSKNGFVYKYSDHVRLIQDNIYLTNEVYDIDDMYLNDDHHMVINHDGFSETVGGMTLSYMTFNKIRDIMMDQNLLCRKEL